MINIGVPVIYSTEEREGVVNGTAKQPNGEMLYRIVDFENDTEGWFDGRYVRAVSGPLTTAQAA